MIWSLFKAEPSLPKYGSYRITHKTIVNVRQGCSLRTLEAAEAVADILKRALQQGVGLESRQDFRGILVGTFEELGLPATPDQPESFLVRSHSGGIVIAASRPVDLANAIWFFLMAIGYRQVFPGPLWEELPVLPGLVKINSVARSPFLSRRLFIGNGQWPENKPAFEDWLKKNLVDSSFVLTTGHYFQYVIRRNKEAFNKDPSLYALVNGQRNGDKLCLSNEKVLRLIEEEILRNSKADSVSIEPSDGGGWCECADCAALGSPSDRMVLLASRISHSLRNADRPAVPAFYAYNQHANPPNLYLSNETIVSVTTKYTNGRDINETLEGWRRKGATLGIRGYWSVFSWDYDLPGGAEAQKLIRDSDEFRLEGPATAVSAYVDAGVRHYTTEMGDNWVAYGHLYYNLARQLWLLPSSIDEVLALFGPASEAMRPYFEAVSSPQLSRETVRVMYASLAAALGTPLLSPRHIERLNHYAAYTRYVELFRQFKMAPITSATALLDLADHVKVLSGKGIVHARAFAQDYARLGPVTSAVEERLVEYVPNNEPLPDFTPHVVQGARAPAINFKRLKFSNKLKPMVFRGPRADVITDYGVGRRVFYILVESPVVLSMVGGLKGGTNPIEITVTNSKYVEFFDVVADGVWRDVSIPGTGILEVEVADYGGGTSIRFPAGLVWAVRDPQAPHFGRRTGYFYVPRGTDYVGGYHKTSVGAIYDSSGTRRLTLPRGSDVFEVAVPLSEEGSIWSYRDCVGSIDLQSVPPWSTAAPGILLVPEDVE